MDRVATLGIRATGFRNQHGEWQHGTLTETPIWGCVVEQSYMEQPTIGGDRQEGDLMFLTRYMATAMADAQRNQTAYSGWYLTLDSVNHKIVEIREAIDYGRRRLMTITARVSS